MNNINQVVPQQSEQQSLKSLTDEPEQQPVIEQEVDVFHNKDDVINYPLLQAIVDNVAFQILVNLLTIYALFGDDIRIIAFNKNADDTFDGITILCLIIFSTEIIITCIVKEGYFNSFFFWLDLISTLSQILDLTMFNQAVGLEGKSSAKSTSQLAQAGKASRTGSKAARVVRLVRLIRIVKLYKAANNQQQLKLDRQSKPRKRTLIFPTSDDNKADIPIHNQPQQHEEKVEEAPKVKESRVSKRLSDSTTKKVIIVVILLLLIMPLFSADYYYEAAWSLEYAARYLKVVAEAPSTTLADINATFYHVIDQHIDFDTPVGYLMTPFTDIDDYQTDNYPVLRESEKGYRYMPVDLIKAGLASNGLNIMLAVSDNSQVMVKNSIVNILNTLFVCAVLLFGALAFAADANTLALEPIERMIIKVNQIAKNPLIAKELKMEQANGQQETTQIENAIIKIGALLALGFGDAGCAIITTNMAKSGDIDPMLPGKRKWAIYGFCDIRNFTDATEVLQKDVMLFVNNIADIVHGMVDRYNGSANKNIGDAFLLVWKIEESQFDEHGEEVKWHNMSYIQSLADLSVISFMKIQAKINRENVILEYRQDTRLSDRLPGYKVKMGFGLHIGWGIEGAIGSEFKIDASYLSPNVNMASRLEAATKQYGVALLISDELQRYFSPDIKKYTRQIDKVTVKGSIKPVGFYTIEMDSDDLPPSKEDYAKDEKTGAMFEKKLMILQQLEVGEFSTVEYFHRNKDIGMLIRNFNQDFYHHFNSGFQSYLDGNWKEAQIYLDKARLLRPNDGPLTTLTTVLKETNFKAPSDWKGYRELTEK